MQTFEILCKRLKKFGEKIVEKTFQMPFIMNIWNLRRLHDLQHDRQFQLFFRLQYSQIARD